VANPKELAKVIDKSAETKNTGITLLQNGWIKAWLVHTKQITENDASAFDNLIKEGKSNWDKIIEGVLGILDPSRPGPKVSVNRNSLDFKKRIIDTEKTRTLMIKNTGKGYLNGIITLEGNQDGITIDNKVIDRNEVKISITVNTLGLEKKFKYESMLIIKTNGGDLEIPVYFRVVVDYMALYLMLFSCFVYVFSFKIPVNNYQNNKFAGKVSNDYIFNWELYLVVIVIITIWVFMLIHSIYVGGKNKGKIDWYDMIVYGSAFIGVIGFILMVYIWLIILFPYHIAQQLKLSTNAVDLLIAITIILSNIFIFRYRKQIFYN
jgi:hypothetical protein